MPFQRDVHDTTHERARWNDTKLNPEAWPAGQPASLDRERLSCGTHDAAYRAKTKCLHQATDTGILLEAIAPITYADN